MTGRSTPGTWTNSSGVTMARLLAVDGPGLSLGAESLPGAAGLPVAAGLPACSASFCRAMARRFMTAARSARAICSARMSGSTTSGSREAMCSILAIWFLACAAMRARASRACSTVMPSGAVPGAVFPSSAFSPAAPSSRAGAALGAGAAAAGTMGLAAVSACSLSCCNRSWRRVGGPPAASCPSFSSSSLMVRSAARSRARIWEERCVAVGSGAGCGRAAGAAPPAGPGRAAGSLPSREGALSAGRFAAGGRCSVAGRAACWASLAFRSSRRLRIGGCS